MKEKYALALPVFIGFVLTGFGQATRPLNSTTWENSSNATNSNLSTIIDNTTIYRTTAPEFNSSPEYINFIDASPTTTGKFIPMKIKILDGPDTDDFGTTLTNLRLTVEDLSNTNQLAMIKTAVLTTSGGTVLATAAKVDNELVFSGMSGEAVTAADDNVYGKILHIRVSIDETQVIDKTKLVFKITSATADPSGSTFATTDAGGAQSDSGHNDRNRLNVTADRLSFETQPSDTYQSINTFPAPVVSLTDLYGRIDLDITTGTITMTSTGTPNTQPASSITNGQAFFNAINHSTAGGPFTLTANYSGWSVISSSFHIYNTPTNSYRTTGTGSWMDNTTTPALWERYNGSAWVVSSSPSYNTSNNVFIRNGHTITSSGSFNSAMSLNVLSEGIFNVNHDGVVNNLIIHDAGKTNINAKLSIHSSGALEVRSNANLTINYRYDNPTTSLWAGTENFHPSSTLLLKNWNVSHSILPNNIALNPNTYGSYTAVFGNIICDFGANLGTDSAVDFLASGVTINLAHGNLIFRSNAAMNSDLLISRNGSVNSGIGGDFHLEDTYAEHQKIKFATSGNLDFTIKGNMILDAATVYISDGSSVNSSIKIDGDLNINSTAALDFNPNVATGSTATINLYGDLSVSESGLLQNSNSSKHGVLNFVGIGDGLTNNTTQTIAIASTSSNENRHINFHIKNHAYVKLINQDFELGRNSSLIVETGGVLDFGFNDSTALNVGISGSQTGTIFSSKQGSTLKITSPEGITKIPNLGNVRTVVSNRSFHQIGTFYYIGKQNQETGSGLPSSSSRKSIYVNLEQDLLELRLTNSVGISDGGKLEIQRGTVIGEKTSVIDLDFHGPNGQLVMTGGEYRISSITNNPLSDHLPQLRKYASYSLTGGTIHLNGNNAIQVLSGIPTYFNLAFSGNNNLALPPQSYNYKGISKAVAITNTVTISQNAIVDVGNNTFGGQSTNLIMLDNARYVTAGVGTKPDAFQGNYTFGPHTTIEFNNNTGLEEIRLSNPVPSYANIVVSGSHVGTQALGTGSNSFIQFQPNGSFTVTETGTFKLKNSFGFSGAHNTAISNINAPTIILENKSTIEYSGASQNITRFNPEYKNLTISGTESKTLGHLTDILIGENLNVDASTLLVKTDEAITVVESVHVNSSGNFNIENSGSLIQIDDTKINSGKISMIRKASIKNKDYVYWSTPITGYNVSHITATDHIYKWDPTATNAKNTQGDWIKATNEIMETGKGYIVRAPNNYPAPATSGDLNFTTTFYSSGTGLGIPNNGEISVTIKRGSNAISIDDTDDNWNLLGNPYPSAISVIDFLVLNTSIDGYVNLWKHGLPPDSTTSPFYEDFALNYHQADYFMYNSTGSSDGPSSFTGYIAAGQGFMVNMVDGRDPASASVIFKNNMRHKNYANNQFFRASQTPYSSEEKNRIWLDLISPTMPTNRVLVGYIHGATMGKDRLFDAKISFDATTDGLYTLINNASYVIQGRALPFNDTDVIPLGLKVTKRENYTLAIGAVDGLFSNDNQIIYLKDHLLDLVHNLSSHPYSFKSEAGTFNNRFEIAFKNLHLSLEDVHVNSKHLSIIELSNGQVQFSIGHHLSIKSVKIIDLMGRSLYFLNGNNATEVYDLSNLSQAAYIAKVKLSNGQIISKRFIKRH